MTYDNFSVCVNCLSPCCALYAINVTDKDIERIMHIVGKSEYFVKTSRWGFPYTHQVRTKKIDNCDGWCYFTNRVAKGHYNCGIYEYRPEACRAFSPINCPHYYKYEDGLIEVKTILAHLKSETMNKSTK